MELKTSRMGCAYFVDWTGAEDASDNEFGGLQLTAACFDVTTNYSSGAILKCQQVEQEAHLNNGS